MEGTPFFEAKLPLRNLRKIQDPVGVKWGASGASPPSSVAD